MEYGSVESYENDLRQHETQSCYRYSSYQAQKDFGHTSLSTANKVYWKDWPSVKLGRQEFTGVPFVVLNKKIYDCQFGKDRKKKRKQRKKAAKGNNEIDYESYVKKPGSKFLVQDTRKIDCPAQVIVREICRFPTYQISHDASHFELETTAEDLLVRIRNGEDIQNERVFILILPDSNVHTCHKPGENAPQDIDPRLARKIREMTEAGVRDVEGMKTVLRSYVADICSPLPDQSSHRFYPRDKIISNHIYEANKGRQRRHEQESIPNFIEEWQKKSPDDFIYCRLKCSETSQSGDNANIQFGATFLFVYMSVWQKRLLQRYGRMAFLDATYKSSLYDLPLFFLAVRTNCCYQIVATFITEHETGVAITEALQLLQEHCPDWEPVYFMTDFQESEVLALDTVFRDASVLLCDVHRNRAWDRWCRLKKNSMGMGSEMVKWLMRLGNAADENHFARTLNELQGSPFWMQHNKFQQYVQRKWLPKKEKWSKAFRTGLIDIVAGTNNGLESLHNVLKAKFLRRKTNYSLSMLLKILLEDFFPSRYQKYVDQNILHSGRFRHYSEDIPKEIQRRPRDFVEHCLKGIGLSKSIDRNCVEFSGVTTEYVVKGNKEFHVTLGDMEHVPNCQCDTWTKFQMPCEHIFAAASDDEGVVQWERISPLYLQSVYCIVDDLKADVVVDNVLDMDVEELDLHEHKEKEHVGEEGPNTDLNVSLKSAQVRTRDSLQVLTGLTYNITDVGKLQDIKQRVDGLVEKHQEVALPPLLPLPKRAEVLKKRRHKLSLLYWFCENCEDWFHPSCVGEIKTKEPENYFCPACKQKETEDRFITVGGQRLYIQDPDDVEEGTDCNGPNKEDRDENPVVDHTDDDDDADIQITGDNSTLFQNYDQIMDELKQTVICDKKRCDLEEHKRHHHFCLKFSEFIQHSSRCHNFGRTFVTFEEEMCITMKMMKDLCISKPDPMRSTGTLPVGTLKIVKRGSKLDSVLTENKIFSSKYIQFVLCKDYIVRHVALQNGWPLEKAECKCQESEVNTRELTRQNRKQSA